MPAQAIYLLELQQARTSIQQVPKQGEYNPKRQKQATQTASKCLGRITCKRRPRWRRHAVHIHHRSIEHCHGACLQVTSVGSGQCAHAGSHQLTSVCNLQGDLPTEHPELASTAINKVLHSHLGKLCHRCYASSSSISQKRSVGAALCGKVSGPITIWE